MDTARKAVERISSGVNIPVAMHVCGKVTHIFDEILQWDLDILSHAFMGDDNLPLLQSKNLLESDKILGFGCVDTKNPRVESVEEITSLIQKALEVLGPERIVIHPDCGLRQLPRDAAYQKLENMVKAAKNALQRES